MGRSSLVNVTFVPYGSGMRGMPRLRAMVCDDDPVLRGVLRGVLSDSGYRVVGEAATTDDARAILDRDEIDLVLLDLALRAGSGEELLRHIRDDHPGVRSVVFSSYIDDIAVLTDSGATATFAKPAFDELERWLREQTTPVQAPNEGFDRRRPPHPAPPLPERGPVSPSGLESWAGLRAAVDGLWPGDAVMALDLHEAEAIARRGDHLHLLDHRLALGRVVSPTLRSLDRVGATPQGTVVCLLVAGHQEAPAAVFRRVEISWDRAGLPGTPIGSFAHIRPDERPGATLGRILDALGTENTPEHPLRLA